MKRAFLYVNAYEFSEHHLYQPRRLQEEFASLGVRAEIVRGGDFAVWLDGGARTTLGAFDFGVYLDKDRYASVLMEACGIRIFNRAAAVAVCDDKMATHLALAERGLPQPKTLPAPLCYYRDAVVRAETVDRVVSELGLPLVVKSAYGSLGKGVYLARTREELKLRMEELKTQPHFFQSYVAESRGRDLRVICIGGRAVAWMSRVSESDFRSNAELGGRCERCELPDAYRTVAERAASALGLDYCGVDLLFGADNPLICEVNSNAFFGGMERATRQNIAESYARYMADAIYGKE